MRDWAVAAFAAGFVVGAVFSEVTYPHVTYPPVIGQCSYTAPDYMDYSQEDVEFAKRLREGVK